MSNISLGRTEQAILTNKSGGTLAQGDVVIVDSSTAASVTTTTTGAYANGRIGVVLEPAGIASNAAGMIAFSGYVPKINLASSASLGDLVKTHTVAKQGTPHAAPSAGGDFAQVLGTGTTPAALLFGSPLSGARALIGTSSPSGTGTVSFTGIPSIYSKLTIEYAARGTAAAGSVSMDITVNNDTTDGNYRRTITTVYAAGTTGDGGGDDNVINDAVIANTGPSGAFTMGKVEIPFYASTAFNKQIRAEDTQRRDTSSVHEQITRRGLEWESTAAINRVDFILASGNFASGSIFNLYGEP